ncbi:MAG: RelA/SpoT domain-containing protein [Candidatus Bathyarchaeota archaeon]|nr:RelA/SpoT domain-containing protein [Candidatus Bathyarchaeota archaeon]
MASNPAEAVHVQNLLNEYAEKRDLFEEYTKTIQFLLENLLRQHYSQFQTVQSRTKELSHFREKLLRKKELQLKPLLKMTDLSACRVIFYFEEDLYQFANILYEEFKIVDDENKVSPNEYNARQIVLKLKLNRCNLPEYAKFKGLLCEVQLTTVLFHAWSEIQHDIIYKPIKEILEFDTLSFDYLNAYFKEIMEKHLKEASRGFSFINYQIDRIRKGQLVIRPDIIDSMSKSTSNNDIYGFLKVLSEYIPKYADRLPPEYGLISALETTLLSAEKNEVVDRKTIFGELRGKNYFDIANEILDLLDRYIYGSNNIRIIIKLGKNPELKKRCEESLNRLSSYRISFLRRYGFSAQRTVLEYISTQTPEYIIDNLEMISAVMKPIASLECEDVTMKDPHKATFTRGYLSVSPSLKALRIQYFDLTKNLLQAVKTDEDKNRVLDLIFSLTQSIHNDKTPEEIVVLVSEEVDRIVGFLTEYYDSVANLTKAKLHRFIFSVERLKLKADLKLLTLREKIDQDAAYNKFRVFYEDDLHYLADFDYEKTQSIRNQKIDTFVGEITEANLKEWLLLFRELATIYRQGEGYSYFSIFLRKLSKSKPVISLELLKEDFLSPFFSDLLSGLLESSEHKKVVELLTDYSKQRERQLAVAQAIFSAKPYDDELFDKFYPLLSKSSDNAVLFKVLQIITVNYSVHKNHKNKVTELINRFTEFQYYTWSHVYFSAPHFWEEMSDENAQAILDNLVKCQNIDYAEEGILGCIARKYPRLVIQFFYKRVQLAKTKQISEAVPFHFSSLNDILSGSGVEILTDIISWLSDEMDLENWYATKLIEVIFPSFEKPLELFTLELVRSNVTKNRDIVLQILGRYAGETSIHNVIKEIIRLYPLSADLQKKLFRILSGVRGAVMGDYGYLEQYKIRKEQAIRWIDDSDSKISNFAKAYLAYIERVINEEKNRVDKEIAFEKRTFDINRS